MPGYKRFHAWLLSHRSLAYDRAVEPYKRELYGALAGTVVEIGPGAGASLAFFGPGVSWIGVEPNRFFVPYLEAQARRLGRAIDVEIGTAERLPLRDRSADAVVSSLVLCTVRDLPRALEEVLRVLRPGGSFVFVEHVAAGEGSLELTLQRAVRPLWGVLADGCRPDRDIEAAIGAAGFASLEVRRFRAPLPVVAPHLAGRGLRPP